MTPKTAEAPVTSVTLTCCFGPICREIQSRSRLTEADPVIQRYSSWAIRVTVTSAS